MKRKNFDRGYENNPTCHYYPDKACERPEKCPVHHPPLLRPRKALHYLRPELERSSWDHDSGRFWWRTYCGIYLHRRLNYEAFLDSVFNDETVKGLTPSQRLRVESDRRMQLDMDGWKEPPIPSKDPAYEVFFIVGWSDVEALAATGRATCKRCLAGAKKKRFLTIARPSTTFDPL